MIHYIPYQNPLLGLRPVCIGSLGIRYYSDPKPYDFQWNYKENRPCRNRDEKRREYHKKWLNSGIEDHVKPKIGSVLWNLADRKLKVVVEDECDLEYAIDNIKFMSRYRVQTRVGEIV